MRGFVAIQTNRLARAETMVIAINTLLKVKSFKKFKNIH